MLNGRHDASTVQRSSLIGLIMEKQAIASRIVDDVSKLSAKLQVVDREACELLEKLTGSIAA
ncbi:MAG: hypothetical protein M1343_13885 [Chloroflexi bacterium]|nr:hypothetical protein [Chloroflexota bacterium]MDA8189298.1 hypothetical protein [Dehalococcoidales bacterium]